MAAKTTNVVSIGTGPTPIIAGATAQGPGGTRTTVLLRNVGAATVYLGGASVTPATGWPLNPGDPPLEDRDSEDPWYGCVSSGTGSVAYILVA